jgi:polynucleotide 5'-triphosphatase
MNSVVQLQPEEYNNPAKRKMEDREMSVEVPRQHNHYDVKTEVNGEHQISPVPAPSPQQRPKKRIRYTEPPIWAQSAKGMKHIGRKLNGKQQTNETPTPPPAALIKQESNGLRQASPAVTRGAQSDDVSWDGPLGPWEPSITGRKPVDEIPKIVADWLYVNVASRNDVGELASRGVEIEIEAKLGQLISKDTGMRVQLPIRSETVLTENSLLTFRSSMTEVRLHLRFLSDLFLTTCSSINTKS